MVVPSGSVFLVKPISFSGPNCEPNIVFQVKELVHLFPHFPLLYVTLQALEHRSMALFDLIFCFYFIFLWRRHFYADKKINYFLLKLKNPLNVERMFIS